MENLLSVLTPELIAKVFSFTDDYTIYNYSISCRLHNHLMNMAKDYTMLQNDAEPLYDKYPLFTLQPTATTNTVTTEHHTDAYRHILTDSIIEHTHTFKSTNEVSSVIILSAESEDQQQASHLITSIRVKGAFSTPIIVFGERSITPPDFPFSSLSTDSEGYVEILSPFMSFIPLFCSQTYFDARLSIKTKGSISIKVKKCNLSPFYITDLQWNNLPFIVPTTKTHSSYTTIAKCVKGQTHNICIHKEQCTKGIFIVIKNNKGELINKKHIRAISITRPSTETQYIMSARSLHAPTIAQTPYYNLAHVKFNHGFYIPLTTLPVVTDDYLINEHIHVRVVLKKPITTSFSIHIVQLYNDKSCFYYPTAPSADI